jgi:WD40 repeat protein
LLIAAVRQKIILKNIKKVSSKGLTAIDFPNHKKNWVLGGGGNGEVKLIDFGTQKYVFGEENQEDFHQDYVKKVRFYGGNDDVLVSGGLDKIVKLWDARMGKVVNSLDFGFEVSDLACGDGHKHGIG